MKSLARREAGLQLMAQTSQRGGLLGRLARARTQEAKRRGQRGMTLLEILIVLAIIGLVMGVLVGPQIYQQFVEGQESVTEAELKKYTTEAYIRYQMKNPGKQCPDSLDDLAQLLGKKTAKDPWGNDYVMMCGDNAPSGSTTPFAVLSTGPDGQQGTEDDIKSWDED